MMQKDDFTVYKEAIEALERSHISYIVGGGIAVAAYGRKRATKDIDLYIKPEESMRALEALRKVGFEEVAQVGKGRVCLSS